ncbi:MAG TPA: CRISPR-associated protein Cas4 [Ktedonobacteraceae bacterium]|nr:CRISPR-associated protein Cas4 [Ktedonobacteraceae bacterium]
MIPHQPPEAIPLSYLNALEYCPRRFYYEFVQGDMLVNEFVLEGTLLHERADDPGQHRSQEGEITINHLYLYSETLKLSGFADIVEEEHGNLIPVEYKHGREGKWLNDHVQLCAQALCLEERQPESPPIPYGYIFYFGSRKRIQVEFTSELRAKTHAAIDLAFQTALLERPPLPLDGKIAIRCRDCSLHTLCLPEEVKLLRQKGDTHANALPD